MGLIMTYLGIIKKMVLDAYRGELELWKTFWVIGIIGHFAVFIIKWLLVSLWPGMGSQIGYVIVYAFAAYWLFLVWRCAMNSEMIVWFFISRLFVVLFGVVWILKVFHIFFV